MTRNQLPYLYFDTNSVYFIKSGVVKKSKFLLLTFSFVNLQDFISHRYKPLSYLTHKRGAAKWPFQCWLMSVLSKLGQLLKRF